MAANALARQLTLTDLDQSLDSSALWAPVSIKLLSHGDRRLEASTFLTDGYGLRQALEALASTVPVADLAAVWMPDRLKGFPVDEGKGLPFLSAGQVFESRPRVRKWLAGAMLNDTDRRRVEPSWLLVSRSGEVGRVTAVYQEHLDTVISDDLLRVVPQQSADYGWLYAYMRTPTFFAIMRSAQYGHMIKHLQPEHLQAMPVAMPETAIRRSIGELATNALAMRHKARSLQGEADATYAQLVNPTSSLPRQSLFATVRSSQLTTGRRRFEAQFHRSDVLQVEALIRNAATHVEPLADVVASVSVGARFKRHFGANGTPYRSASELFDVNPPVTKRIYSALLPDPGRYMLKAGWIIMACSGQTYGLLGRSMALTENHDGVFGSHDLIRIVPDETRVRTGYLQTLLSHMDYGRPRVVRFATGTSVPHLDPSDIRQLFVPRFGPDQEDTIAELSDQATELAAEADRLETAAIAQAESVIAHLTGRHGSIRNGGGQGDLE